MGEQKCVLYRKRDKLYSPIPCERGPDFQQNNEKPKTGLKTHFGQPKTPFEDTFGVSGRVLGAKGDPFGVTFLE